MATTMDWGTLTFTVYQADMTPLGGSVYELDVEALRQELHALQASVEGMAFPDIFFHNTEVLISGTTFVRTLGIINGYSMTISPAGAYKVSCKGANHNLQDVYNNLTGPTFLPNNSAGLIVSNGGAAPTSAEIADAVWDEPRADHAIVGTMGDKLGRQLNLVVESPTVIRESD